MKTKKDFIEAIENNPKEIQAVVEEFGKIRVKELYHIDSGCLDYHLDKHGYKWEQLQSIQKAIRDYGLEQMREKYESISNLDFGYWLTEKYRKSSATKKILLHLYEGMEAPKKDPKKMVRLREIKPELNKGLWDRTEVKPYWLNEGEIVEVGRGYIPGVKLNPYSGVPILI